MLQIEHVYVQSKGSRMNNLKNSDYHEEGE